MRIENGRWRIDDGHFSRKVAKTQSKSSRLSVFARDSILHPLSSILVLHSVFRPWLPPSFSYSACDLRLSVESAVRRQKRDPIAADVASPGYESASARRFRTQPAWSHSLCGLAGSAPCADL